MIRFNEKYTINNGKGEIIFSDDSNETITAKYTIDGQQSTGTISGVLRENLVQGTFQVENTVGLMEISFHENEFAAKWKIGTEPGPMKGKWIGKIILNLKDVSLEPDSCIKFISYIKENYELSQSYGDTIDTISNEDFVELYSIEYDQDFFGNLKNYLDVVKITVDNSEYSIDEQDGSDQFVIFYDFKHNCVYQQFPSNSDDYYKYIGTWHASISSFYKESKKFYGCYSISDLKNTWSIVFQGDYESHEGSLDDEVINNVKEQINSSSFYLFLDEVLEYI